MNLMGVICFFLLNSSVPVGAHGEDKPGPHGGHIQMPGAFHTELMLDESQGAHIFLLDINFQNPTVKDSKIEMKFVGDKKQIPFTCSVMGGNHFHCVPQGKYPNKGELRLKPIREKVVGAEVIYKIPLETAKAPAKSNHQGH